MSRLMGLLSQLSDTELLLLAFTMCGLLCWLVVTFVLLWIGAVRKSARPK